MGGRGAVHVATPSLPANACETPVNVAVRMPLRFWRLFHPWRRRTAPCLVSPTSCGKPNETRGGTIAASFLPLSASPPPLGLCAHWSL